MAENDKEEKKVIVDEDWKAEAQKEKEILKKEEELEHKDEEKEQERPSMPEADFAGLISMITTQAYYAMGLIGTEQDKERQPDLAVAKYNIDMLGVIEEKTKGNLNEEEVKLLEGALGQLRMLFVQLAERGG